eukprot:TRINITY_DN7071_c0_g2_i1.p2 TRINITY_DN7071_c0_g2~~TRINITY_DN7071_c0_g2_i1.p2  ORF type:complete len:110 (-),score=17.43 TRINITY_DN7071_c0_g2_i1:310-639(-)
MDGIEVEKEVIVEIETDHAREAHQVHNVTGREIVQVGEIVIAHVIHGTPMAVNVIVDHVIVIQVVDHKVEVEDPLVTRVITGTEEDLKVEEDPLNYHELKTKMNQCVLN